MHFLPPYVRIELLIRTTLTRTWAPEAWPLVKHELVTAIKLRRQRARVRVVQLIVVQDYRGYRIEIVAQLVDGAGTQASGFAARSPR